MGIWLGSNKCNPRKPRGFKWNLDTIKILYLRTQCNPNAKTKLEKGKKKSGRMYKKGDIYNYDS